MKFSKELIQAVANGERPEELKNYPPNLLMSLGLIVREAEKEKGMDRLKVDIEAIGKTINKRNGYTEDAK